MSVSLLRKCSGRCPSPCRGRHSSWHSWASSALYRACPCTRASSTSCCRPSACCEHCRAAQVQWEVPKPLSRPAFKLALVGQLGVASRVPLHRRLLSIQHPFQLQKHSLVSKAVWQSAS